MPVTRCLLTVASVLILLTGCAPDALPSRSPTSTIDNPEADAVMRAVRDVMAEAHLKAAIVRVTVDGTEVVTEALGESMTGVPATTNMHFRNGAVAISYVATLLLELVDEKKVRLDDKLSKWLPEIPHADRVTLGQLAQMTSGYVDYVIGNTAMNAALYENPFRRWTTHDLLDFAVNRPLLYEPGTNWNYAHTNYVLLGLVLEKATGQDMPKLLSDKVLRPLGLTNTANSSTAEIPSPALHAFSSERRAALRIRPASRSTRRPRIGIRPGRSLTVRSRPPTSTTWRRRRSASARAGCSPPTRIRRWWRPICAARPTSSPGVPPATR
jgi:CubicO group peptidase (beta-lactamase class C family)